MAYRSRYKFASRPRRRISGRIKRRRLRRKAPRRARKMSTRAILNKTSQKKRDHMLSFSNTTASDPFSPTFSLGPAVMSFRAGSTQPSEFVFIWNATGRPAENSDGQRGSKVDVSLRTSESIFAVGVKERITLETNNSAPWQWRRICFTSKDDFGQRDPDTSDYFRRTSNGMVRLVRAQNEVTYLQDQLFEGQRNQDWLSMITAPVSTRHYSIKYDKTRVIKSQNDSGLTHNYKLWHPMRSNINTTANRPVRH